MPENFRYKLHSETITQHPRGTFLPSLPSHLCVRVQNITITLQLHEKEKWYMITGPPYQICLMPTARNIASTGAR